MVLLTIPTLLPTKTGAKEKTPLQAPCSGAMLPEVQKKETKNFSNNSLNKNSYILQQDLLVEEWTCTCALRQCMCSKCACSSKLMLLIPTSLRICCISSWWHFLIHCVHSLSFFETTNSWKIALLSLLLGCSNVLLSIFKRNETAWPGGSWTSNTKECDGGGGSWLY